MQDYLRIFFPILFLTVLGSCTQAPGTRNAPARENTVKKPSGILEITCGSENSPALCAKAGFEVEKPQTEPAGFGQIQPPCEMQIDDF